LLFLFREDAIGSEGGGGLVEVIEVSIYEGLHFGAVSFAGSEEDVQCNRLFRKRADWIPSKHRSDYVASDSVVEWRKSTAGGGVVASADGPSYVDRIGRGQEKCCVLVKRFFFIAPILKSVAPNLGPVTRRRTGAAAAGR
jgi:hypothetical protein